MKNFKIIKKIYNLYSHIFKIYKKENIEIFQIVIFLITLLILWATFSINTIIIQNKLKVGIKSPQTIIANNTFSFIDEKNTKKQINQIKQRIWKKEPVYKINEAKTLKIRKKFLSFLKDIDYIIDKNLSFEEKIKYCETKNKVNFPYNFYKNLFSLKKEEYDKLKSSTIWIINKLLKKGISKKDKENLNNLVLPLQEEIGLNKEFKTLSYQIIKEFIKPNLEINKAATEVAIKNLIKKLKPIKKTIHRGDIIIHKGEIITPLHIKIIKEMGIYAKKNIIKNIIFYFIVSFFIINIYLIILATFFKNIYSNKNKLILTLLIFISTIVLTRISLYFNNYITLIVTGTVLTTLFLPLNLSMFTVFLFSTIFAIYTNSLQTLIINIIIGFTTAFAMKNFKKLSDSITILITLIIITSISVSMFYLVGDNIKTATIISVISTVISYFIGIGLIPFLEKEFNIASPIKLLELMNLNEPLLKMLSTKAPGTYHHSTLVSVLAEEAAISIGANSLLTKVGALYHDIGKTKRPNFFIENQFSGQNPHDRYSPQLSAIIITSHTKDGIELAKKYKLPIEIQDFIIQHHGTSLVSYFYHKALSKGSTVIENDFRYSGPKPQTKETAIVMIADSIEAATRANLNNLNQTQKIDSIIKSIVNKLMLDGQLDESNLTFKELNIIINSLSKTIQGMYHNRIEYPK